MMTTKTCCKCQITKSVAEFGKLLSSKDGYAKRCRPCANAATRASKRKSYVPHPRQRASDDVYKEKRKQYYEKNRERLLLKTKQYQKDNREKTNTKNAEWKKRNLTKVKAMVAAWLERNRDLHRMRGNKWKKDNPDKANANTWARRARKQSATVAWGNDFFIREAYHLARLRKETTGICWNVDHIVPLRSRVVCGLHVETNLQVIPAQVNRSKGNRYWPDMPEVNHA